MTAIHPHIAAPTHPLSIEGLTLAWDVLPDAPGAQDVCDPGACADARLLVDFGRQELRVVLETTAGRGGPVRRTTLRTIVSPIRVTLEGEARGRRLIHVEAPGAVRATIAFDADNTPRVWFARSPLLASMGFPAGSYDRPAAAWRV